MLNIRLIPKLVPVAIVLLAYSNHVSGQALVTWTGGAGGSFNWSSTGNWTNGNATNYGTLTFAGSTGTTNVDDSITSQNKIIWTGASNWTLNQGGSTVLSLFDYGGSQAKLENDGTGLVTINLPITFAANNASPPNPFGEINAVNGDMTFGTGALTVNGSSVNGIKLFGSGHTTTFNNTVSASGKWFGLTGANTTMVVGGAFTSGDIYVMNNGTLKLASGGTIATSAIRLGGDFGNTGNQNQAQGGTFALAAAAGGQTFTNTINTVSGNTSGALVVDSQNTSNTNTISGNIFLDSGLKIQQAAGGTLALTGTTFDIKAQSLTLSGAGNINISAAISNGIAGGTVTSNNTGVIVLSNSNTYSGDTTILSGKLQFTAAGSSNNSSFRLGSTSGTTAVEVDLTSATGGTVINSVINPVVTTGSGTVTVASQNTSGINTLGGHFGLDRDMTLSQTAGGTLNVTQARAGGTGTLTGIDIKTRTLFLTGGGNINFSGDVYNSTGTGVGTIQMNNTGTTTLGGSQDNVSLAAVVNSGTLMLAKVSSGSIHAIGSGLTINNGGAVQLAGSGGDQIYDNSTVAVNGGSLNISSLNETVGAVTLASGGSIVGTTGTLSGTSFGVQSGSITGRLGGTGGLVKTTSGTVSLNGANVYAGSTTITSGALIAGVSDVAGTSGAFGNASSAILLGDSGTNSTGSAALLIGGSYTVARNITVQALGAGGSQTAIIGGTNNSNTATYSGSILLNRAVTLQAATSGTVDFKGGTWTTNNNAINVGSSGNTGTVVLDNAVSTTGGVNVQNGELRVNSLVTGNVSLASSAALSGTGSISGTASLTGGNTVSSSGNLTAGAFSVSGSNNTIASGSITGDVTQSGNSSLTVNGVLAGNNNMGYGSSLKGVGSVTGQVNTNGNNSVSSTGSISINGLNVSGAGNVIGSGTVTSVAGTVVNANSTLAINSTLGGGGVTVSGTIGGNGTVTSAVTVNSGGATLPGLNGSPGKLTVDLNYNAGSSAQFTFANSATADSPRKVTAGTDYDQVIVTGSSNPVLTIGSNGPGGSTIQGDGTSNSNVTLQVNLGSNASSILTMLGTNAAGLNGNPAYLGSNTGQYNYYVFLLGSGASTGYFSTLTLTDASGNTLSGTVYYSGPNDRFNGVANLGDVMLTGTLGSLLVNQEFAVSYTGDYLTNSTIGGNDIVITAVPEPGTWVMTIAGFGILASLKHLRKKSRG